MKPVKLYKLLILFFSFFLSFFKIYYLFVGENSLDLAFSSDIINQQNNSS